METFSALLALCAANSPEFESPPKFGAFWFIICSTDQKYICTRHDSITVVLNLVVIGRIYHEHEHCEVSLNFELDRNIFSGAGLRNMMTSSNGNIFRVTGPLCGEFTGPGEVPAQRSVTRSFDVCFDLLLNKRLSKQPWGWWFETPAWSLWRHRNDLWL